MTRTTPRFLALTLAVSVFASPAVAGQLAADIANSYQASWAGTSAYSSGTLNGTVDWAVYGPGTAPAGYAGMPVPGPGELLYTYQIINGGPDVSSSLSVHVENAAYGIGTFTAALIDAFDAPFFYEITGIPGDAAWYFGGIAGGEDSTGLAFLSPNVPMWDTAIVLDGGQSDQIAVPSTSPVNIPEPGTLTLVACGAMALGWHRLRRRSAARR
jgi:hypothetical protein